MSTNFGRPPIDDPFSAFIAGRRDKEARINAERDRTLDFLGKMSENVTPEYRNTMNDLMAQVMAAPTDKKGRKIFKDALDQIHQIHQGVGPNVQNKTNDFAGYQGAGAENSITPAAPTASPVSDNISAAISNPNTAAAPAGPVSMLGRYGSSANFATPTSLTAPVGAPATAPVSLVGNDDIQGGGLMAQPPASGGVSMIKAPTPVQLNSTVAKPGFQAKGAVSLIEDPVAREKRRQDTLLPGQIKLYEAQQTAEQQRQTNLANINAANKKAQIQQTADNALKKLGDDFQNKLFLQDNGAKIKANAEMNQIAAGYVGNPAFEALDDNGKASFISDRWQEQRQQKLDESVSRETKNEEQRLLAQERREHPEKFRAPAKGPGGITANYQMHLKLKPIEDEQRTNQAAINLWNKKLAAGEITEDEHKQKTEPLKAQKAEIAGRWAQAAAIEQSNSDPATVAAGAQVGGTAGGSVHPKQGKVFTKDGKKYIAEEIDANGNITKYKPVP